MNTLADKSTLTMRSIIHPALYFGLILSCSFFAGCSLLAVGGGDNTPIETQYDLGLAKQSDTTPLALNFNGGLSMADITAPHWLDLPEMRYRPADGKQGELRSFAYSLWVASPRAMLDLRLREQLNQHLKLGLLSPNEARDARYELQLKLIQFEQDFSESDSSEAKLAVDAVLYDNKQRRRIAFNAFRLSQAATANPAGGVAALRELSNSFASELLSWLNQHD